MKNLSCFSFPFFSMQEKTGGKIIYSRGGIIYLFRGRNYNHKTRPRFPLMLWKPATPVYPRLIQRAPEGLTVEEAQEMRNKGLKLIPICKLGMLTYILQVHVNEEMKLFSRAIVLIRGLLVL